MTIEKYINSHIKEQNNKTYIVTGANSGIGFEISKILLEKNATVIFACRNEERANKAINSLDTNIKDRAIFVKLDMADFSSIDQFICEIKAKFPDFDGIICNAGVLKPKKEAYTKQGFKCVVGTNLLGTIYLVEQINKHFDEQKKIVLQSSLLGRVGKYKTGDLINAESMKFHAYNISKLGVNVYFDELLNRDDFIHSVYLSEPGACYSNIYSSFPKFILPLANLFMKIVFHSPKKGGLSALCLLCGEYSNGTILIPRGLFALSGYPKKINLSRRIKKSRTLIRDDYRKLLKDYL